MKLTSGSAGYNLDDSGPHTETSLPHLPGYSSADSGVSSSYSGGERLTNIYNWVHQAGRTRACGVRTADTDAQESSPK